MFDQQGLTSMTLPLILGVIRWRKAIRFRGRRVRTLFHFRPGEVTLWAGVNGHGKSLMTGFIGLELMAHMKRLCIASFEMKPKRTLERMLRQWAGYNPAEFNSHPDAIQLLRELYGDMKAQAESRLWFYDQQGTVSSERIVSVARYCAKELKIDHMFIDSLMKCVKAEDDYNGQKYLVDELTAIARDHGMHIHLVHHLRKLENEGKKPDKSDVKGTGAITDQVDNVLLVWRNKAENRKPTDPDAALICCKQRNGEWEGGINLWFDPASQQYLGEHGQAVRDFSKVAL
jgi:twinkle protein